MNYRQSLEYLFGLQQFGIKLGLDNVEKLLARLGHPERELSIVHIAGTNGKGSTAAALAAILAANGIRTGLYTSPHLQSFTERIQVGGISISEQQVAELTLELRELATGIPATFFEFTTVMALEYFRRSKVERVILETGLGGRLDATNAVLPELCLLTPISFDHQAHLGDDLASIAAEKAGILKSGVAALTAPQPPAAQKVLAKRCTQLGISLRSAGADWQVGASGTSRFSYVGLNWKLHDLPQSLPGRHQLDNLGLALAAVEQLADAGCVIDPETFPRALAGLSWPGRLEWFSGPPRLLLDGAHNQAGATALEDYLRQSDSDELLWVAAFKEDKSWSQICDVLGDRTERVYCAPLAEQASVSPAKIVDRFKSAGRQAEAFNSVPEALSTALATARSGQLVLVAGSLFLVAEARPLVLSLQAQPGIESGIGVG